MKKIYFDTSIIDKKCIEKFGIDERILMENAASKIEEIVRKKLNNGSTILAICGGGNNGADAICALRKLSGDYRCYIYLTSKKCNQTNKFQQNIAKNIGINFIDKIIDTDCLIDGIFGSGLNKELDIKTQDIINQSNSKKCFKIAVDVPSGIDKYGNILPIAFKADITITMGARKLALYSDIAKDYVGKIVVANLGISSQNYEIETNSFLLDKTDMKLPFRTQKCTNKCDFGHTFVVLGDMIGACEIAALSANAIGSGLVSVVSEEKVSHLNPILMQKNTLENSKVVVAGCGLGKKEFDLTRLMDKICVIDADLFYRKEIIEFLKKNKNVVITPHPKEFASLLKLANIADVNVIEIQKNRFEFSKMWSEKFDNVLILKGANSIIAYEEKLFIMPFGSSILSKGGSGDALSGIIGGLLAQGYNLLDASITATIAHALSAKKVVKNSYSLNALDIIKGIKCL